MVWLLLCLDQNMVGPGEVDKDLEPETAEECTKYGKVIKCVIFEVNKVIKGLLSCYILEIKLN